MKAERRHELKQNSLVRNLEHLPDTGKIYGTRILLGLILVIIVFLLVRYRINANADRMNLARIQLASAAENLGRLRSTAVVPVGQEAGTVQARSSLFSSGVQSAQDAFDAAPDKDDQLKAEALIAKGDLNFEMANLPQISLATKQPETVAPNIDQYLSDSEGAYNQALQYPDQISTATAARFGLAAVAENRAALNSKDGSQWEKAHQQYDAIVLSNAPEGFRKMAQNRDAMLASLRQPLFTSLAPITTTQPTQDLALPDGPMPSTAPIATTQATTR